MSKLELLNERHSVHRLTGGARIRWASLAAYQRNAGGDDVSQTAYETASCRDGAE